MNVPRYAIYLAPPAQSALWRFGSAVIGYDAETGLDAGPPPLKRFAPAAWREATAEPRRYGFHGTLKAPFRLAEGRDEAGLRAAARDFAAQRARFACAGMQVVSIGRFIALKPVHACAALDRLAAGAVEAFEPFRAPPTAQELERRRRAPLSERQKDHLSRWGYPYVMEDFRFHMTLTGPMDDEPRRQAEAELAEIFTASPADGPLIVSEIALYRQQDGGSFRLIERLPLGTATIEGGR
ncbi:DUF1045 domain-containing protein [Ancylobacter terrae]|uniref:DUF1045 domain-containing protein n=1 Tax=Ancylobacter sp. sgz301288 TaxID=3342077 RepID=UPI00385AC410